MATPEQIRVAVGDTELGAIRWPCPHATSTVVAIHGITANAWSWAAVASQLDGVVCLVAVDLRGRGTQLRTRRRRTASASTPTTSRR